jgi:hypothetical protein
VRPEGRRYCFEVERRQWVCLSTQTAKAYHIPGAREAQGSPSRDDHEIELSRRDVFALGQGQFALRQFCDLCVAAQYPDEANDPWA